MDAEGLPVGRSTAAAGVAIRKKTAKEIRIDLASIDRSHHESR